MKDLLIPKFEVIADYPNCSFQKGSILERIPSATNNHYSILPYIFGNTIMFETLEKYPHLFRKMGWWESIKDEDFPKYCKVGLTIVNSEDICIDEKNNRIYAGQDEYWLNKCTFMPATEKEYTDYIFNRSTVK